MESGKSIGDGFVVAGFLSEVAVFAIFFLPLIAATLAAVPDVAKPISTLDYTDAILSSFLMVFLFSLLVGKRIESGFVLHGTLSEWSAYFCSR